MVISARYKHFLYFPLRLIDYPSPEVREYLSSSCRIIKIRSKKYSSTSLLGADAAPVSDDPRPQFPSAYSGRHPMPDQGAENTRAQWTRSGTINIKNPSARAEIYCIDVIQHLIKRTMTFIKIY